MNRRAAAPAVAGGGHGDIDRRGRPSFQTAWRPEVLQAAERLLRLGGASAVSRETSWAGGRIRYLEAGAGPALVLLHGAGGGAENWFGVLGQLALERRIIVPDLPGFGLSDPAPLVGPLAAGALPALEAVLEAAHVHEMDLCGTSFGGLLAVRFVQAHPERLRRLALLAPAGLGSEMPRGLRVVALPVLGPLLMQRPTARAIRWELRRLTTTLPLPREREDALVAYLHACARYADRTWFARAIRRFCAPRGQREILGDAELAVLSPPTLLLWGTRDRFFPLAHARRAAQRIPRSILLTLPGVGHSPNWERPAEVAALLAAFFRA